MGKAVYVLYSLYSNIRNQSTVYIGKAVYVFYSLFSNIRLQSTVYIGKAVYVFYSLCLKHQTPIYCIYR